VSITVIILQVTHLGGRCICRYTPGIAPNALPSTDSATGVQAGRTLAGHNDRTSITVHIDQTITVIVASVTDFRAAIRRTKYTVTGITLSVIVAVCLLGVGDLRTIVTEITDAVTVIICLVGVRYRRAVVVLEANFVSVFIGARQPHAPLGREAEFLAALTRVQWAQIVTQSEGHIVAHVRDQVGVLVGIVHGPIDVIA